MDKQDAKFLSEALADKTRLYFSDGSFFDANDDQVADVLIARAMYGDPAYVIDSAEL